MTGFNVAFRMRCDSRVAHPVQRLKNLEDSFARKKRAIAVVPVGRGKVTPFEY